MNKILLATDGSDNSIKAAQYVADNLKGQSDTTVVVLTVTQEILLGMYQPYVSTKQLANLNIRISNVAEDILTKTCKPLEENAITYKTMDVNGIPGETIVQTAEKIGATQIVMGTRGYGFLTGLLLGSVSQQVLHITSIPVTLVKL